jgi:membrane fusion protein, protease secretion system
LIGAVNPIFLDRFFKMLKATPPIEAGEVDMNDARPSRWGWWLLILGFGGFLLWALTAPLDAGVSAPGTVVVTGYRKAVQALVSGKIVAILARDGDEVTSGQALVRLDDTQSRSQWDIAMGQWFTTLATKARLEAERSGRAALVFPPALTQDTTDQRAISVMTLQTQLFTTRRSALRSELSAMAENMQGIELQLRGLVDSREAKTEQLRLLREQLKNQRELADEGLIPRNRVLDQERSVAVTLGAIAEDTGTIGHSRQSIAEVKARMTTREQEVRKEVETLLSDIQREESSLHSKLDALQFDLVNTVIKSPADGLVMGLAVHTVGGVAAAGTPMMEVVPKNEILKIEAQIPPHLIDKVKTGLSVDILFTGLNQVKTPRIDGKVISVSADALVDPRQNVPYFKALVEVTPQGLLKLKANEIRPGMQVEVFVRTGERTAMNYFVKPLLDRLHSAMSEP